MERLTLPEYTVLEKISNITVEEHCDHCNRLIKNVNVIRNNKLGTTFRLGGTCTMNFLGKTVNEINEENTDYIISVKIFDENQEETARRREFKRTFQEAEPKMLEYIEQNQSNPFIRSMSSRIESTGSLTKNMYSAVYVMMLPKAELPKKVEKLKFRAIKLIKRRNDFGDTYTLVGEVDGKSINIYFSSLNEKHTELFADEYIMQDSGIYDNLLSRNVLLTVSGNFDGNKITRAKVTKGE